MNIEREMSSIPDQPFSHDISGLDSQKTGLNLASQSQKGISQGQVLMDFLFVILI